MVRFDYDIRSLPRPQGQYRRYAYIFDGTTGNLAHLWLATGNHWWLEYRYDHLHRLSSRLLHGGVSWVPEFEYRERGGYATLQARG